MQRYSPFLLSLIVYWELEHEISVSSRHLDYGQCLITRVIEVWDAELLERYRPTHYWDTLDPQVSIMGRLWVYPRVESYTRALSMTKWVGYG
jgi:hypothetical protein